MANRFFTYEFLAWRTAGRSNGTTRVLVNVTSTGIFADFLKDVPFTLEDGQTKTSGLISIPIHPLDPLPVCKAINLPTKSAPLRVYLTGKTEFTVSLGRSNARDRWCSGRAAEEELGITTTFAVSKTKDFDTPEEVANTGTVPPVRLRCTSGRCAKGRAHIPSKMCR